MRPKTDVVATAAAVAAYFCQLADLPCVKQAYIGRARNPDNREAGHRRGGKYHVLFVVDWVGGHRLAQRIETAALELVAGHPKLGNKARDGRGAWRRGAQALYVVIKTTWPMTRLCMTPVGRCRVRDVLAETIKARRV